MNDRGRIKELVNLILEIQKTKDWIGNAFKGVLCFIIHTK